jgi:hypothetical protein
MNPADPTNPAAGGAPAPSANAVRRAAQQRRRRFIVWSLVLLAALALVGWKFVVPRLKAMRARQFVAEADALIRRDEFNAAMPKILSALRFAPNDPQVLRTAAKLFAEFRIPMGLGYYQMLLKTPAATAEDRLGYVKMAMALNRVDIVSHELGDMIKQDPNNLELRHLLIQQQMEMHEFGRAARNAAAALILKPDDEKTLFVYGNLLLKNPTNSFRAAGRRTLWGLALTDGPYSDAAAEALTSSTELERGEIQLLMHDLLARTNHRAADAMRAYDLRMRLEPGRSNALMAEVFDKLTATNHSPELLFQLTGWATQRGLPEVALSRLPADAVGTNAALATTRAFTLAAAGHWNELAPILEDKNNLLDPVVVSVLRGRMSLASGKRADAEGAFKAAVEQAGSNSAKLGLVARQAETAGLPLVAVSAWQKLLQNPRMTISAAMEISRLMRGVDDLIVMRDTLKQLNERLPGDELMAGERAWADVLLKDRLKESQAVAEHLTQTRSGDPQWRFLVALASLRQEKPAEALALIENDATNWDQLSPRLQAVYVAALGANQQREAARTYARKINQKGMRSAEKELVTPWL